MREKNVVVRYDVRCDGHTFEVKNGKYSVFRIYKRTDRLETLGAPASRMYKHKAVCYAIIAGYYILDFFIYPKDRRKIENWWRNTFKPFVYNMFHPAIEEEYDDEYEDDYC